jgi:hypothetical protein
VQALIDNSSPQPELQQSLEHEITNRNSDLVFAFELKGRRPHPWPKDFISRQQDMVDARRLIDYWGAVWPSLDWRESIRRLIDDGSLLPEMLARIPTSDDVENFGGLIWRIIQAGPHKTEGETEEAWKALYRQTALWLQGMSKDQWVAVLTNSRSEAWIALALNEKGESPLLKSPFEEAMLDYGQALISGDAGPPDEKRMDEEGHWSGLPYLIRDGGNDLAVQLRLRLANRLAEEEVVGAQFWTLFGPFLSENESFRSHDMLIPEVVANAVRIDDLESIRWFADLFTSHPELLQQHTKSKVRKLKDLVREKISEDGPEELALLAASLKIRMDKGDAAADSST